MRKGARGSFRLTEAPQARPPPRYLCSTPFRVQRPTVGKTEEVPSSPPPQEDPMATDRQGSVGVSSSTALLVGAISSGVNGPTWIVLKIIFLMLGISLLAVLFLAFSSSDIIIAGHVILLVIIAGVLFILLSSFLAQTGLVSVEQQMEEMGISQKRNSEGKNSERKED